jgi:hypothetical protein
VSVRALLLALVQAAAVGAASGETIVWYSDPGQTNVQSDLTPMPAGFGFELGVFAGGFVPTSANTGEWLANWRPAASTSYNAGTGRFAASFEVSSNPAPFVVGARAWVFGRRPTATGAEWILFRHSGWLWPAPNPLNPIPLDWNAKSAGEVVLGEIKASGSPYLMKSAVVPPPLEWAQWQSQELAGTVLKEPAQDADGDGIPNLLEFVFGSSPLLPDRPSPTPVTVVAVNGERFLQISIPRRSDRRADLVVEVSSDCMNWQSGSAFTTTVSETPSEWVVRDRTAMGPSNPRRFMRLRATLPPGS